MLQKKIVDVFVVGIFMLPFVGRFEEPHGKNGNSSQLKFPDCESNLQKGGQFTRKTVILGESKSFKLCVFAAKVTSKAEKCIISSNLHADGQ